MTRSHHDRRTALITGAGIAAVVVAGAFAVVANIGILDASSGNQIGTLTAAGDLAPTTAAPTTSAVPTAPAGVASGAPAIIRTYTVDVAGSVEIASTDDAVTVSAVTVNPGWTWTPGASDASGTVVTFSDGRRSLVFTATRSADGTVGAGVDELAPDALTGTTTAPATPHDADHDHDEHEGRDDDD